MNELQMQLDALMRLYGAKEETEREKAAREIRAMMMEGFYLPCRDPEMVIRDILLELGAPDHLVGHPYVVYGIQLVVEDRTYIDSITFGLYPQIAARFDTTAARVERAIRHLIEVTWFRGDLDILEKYFGNTISASRGKPTNGEFIARMANVVKASVQKAA